MDHDGLKRAAAALAEVLAKYTPSGGLTNLGVFRAGGYNLAFACGFE